MLRLMLNEECIVIPDRQGAGHVKSGGEFILPEYELFVTPKDGLIFAFSTSTVLHCTRVAQGYDVIGMLCSAKSNVVDTATSRTQDIVQYFGDRKYSSYHSVLL